MLSYIVKVFQYIYTIAAQSRGRMVEPGEKIHQRFYTPGFQLRSGGIRNYNILTTKID